MDELRKRGDELPANVIYTFGKFPSIMKKQRQPVGLQNR